ncbi:MAG: hypothetical protein ACM33C_02910 [Syntrophaceae bacterium]
MKRLLNMILVFALAVSFAGCAGMANGMGTKDTGMQSGMGSKDTGMGSGMAGKDAGMHGGMVGKDAKVKCPKCGATFTVDEGRRGLDGP